MSKLKNWQIEKRKKENEGIKKRIGEGPGPKSKKIKTPYPEKQKTRKKGRLGRSDTISEVSKILKVDKKKANEKLRDFLELGDGLDERERMFVDNYLTYFNATRAYIAGYCNGDVNILNAKGARAGQVASDIIHNNLKVRAAIKKTLEERHARMNLEADKVLLEVAYIAFSNVKEVFNETGSLRSVSDLPDNVARAIQSIDVEYSVILRKHMVKKIKFYDKFRALQELGVYFGLFTPEGDRRRDPKEIAAAIKKAVKEIDEVTQPDPKSKEKGENDGESNGT